MRAGPSCVGCFLANGDNSRVALKSLLSVVLGHVVLGHVVFGHVVFGHYLMVFRSDYLIPNETRCSRGWHPEQGGLDWS